MRQQMYQYFSGTANIEQGSLYVCLDTYWSASLLGLLLSI